MKRKKINAIVVLIIFLLAGCSESNSKLEDKVLIGSGDYVQQSTEKEAPITEAVETEAVETEAVESEVEEAETELGNDQLIRTSAEIKKYPKLEQVIMEYFEISQEDAKLFPTQYYYNYADTDGNGAEEIFVLVMGALTSGTGGSTLLHVFVEEDELKVNQSIPIVEYPIIVSDSKTNGIKDIIITNYDLSESGYLKIVSIEGKYQNPNDGESLVSLTSVKGQMLMDNDIFKDRADKTALYLAEGGYFALENKESTQRQSIDTQSSAE